MILKDIILYIFIIFCVIFVVFLLLVTIFETYITQRLPTENKDKLNDVSDRYKW